MRKIKKLVDNMNEEICGAQDYAEKYVEYKAKEDIPWANRFKEMANDELKHAMYIHEMAISEIEELQKIYTPPEGMMEKWEKAHKKYVEKVAFIKQMLTL